MGKLFKRVFVAILPILVKEGFRYYKERKRTSTKAESTS
ncbi:hypothetical protein FIU87_04145 [Bacillus sp. THAF10]|nr:hypothetical protein FIU87_04145 [Bacillus sp. THAF10]